MASTSLKPPSSVADEEFSTRTLLANVNKRLTKVALFSSLSSIGMVAVLWMMVPLKKSVPYIVEVDRTTHEVNVPAAQLATAFKPSWVNSAYFIKRWITDLYTINQYLTAKINDPRAQLYIRGQNAISEFKAFRKDDQTFERLVANPGMTRDVQILNLTPIAGTDNGAVAQVMLTTHDNGQEKVETKLMTLYYVLIPSSDPAELSANPIGLYITDFKTSDK